MNICVVCHEEFEPSKNYPERKTCSNTCLSLYMKTKVNQNFLKNSFKKGHKTFNKGIPSSNWLSKEAREKCAKTYIQYQKCISPLAKVENRYLPHNTYEKGTVVKRSHIHNKGRFKGKVETEYYINIDWKGNRKPNNLYKRYLWEVAHQCDIPKGYVVYCKDGNPDNLSIDNLILITRGELAVRNRWKTKENKNG